MAEDRILAYRKQVEQAAGTGTDGPLQALLLELMKEVEGLAEENKRLRQALVKSTQRPSGMSSKLKDALYE